MLQWPLKNRSAPIGVDIGARSVKLVQFAADRKTLLDAVRWDVSAKNAADKTPEADALADALVNARANRAFRGRDAVVCLGRNELFLQNVRVPKASGEDLDRLVKQEAAGRLPYSVSEMEIRYLEAADVRHGDATLREVIVLACHRPVLDNLLDVVQRAGLNPVAVEIESNALTNSYVNQFRRDDDRRKRSLLVHIGHSGTAVVIVEDDDTLFVKYLDIGGREMDEAVARHLKMEPAEATALRRHNGDRRADQQDPEVAKSIAAATRGVVEKLIAELSLCIRYHSVTFRGQPLARLVLGGGEATETLGEILSRRLDLKCELFEPLRGADGAARSLRQGQWDVAAGLALRKVDQRR